MDKFEVANALRETGLLLTVSGSNPFKARAYLRGASSIESISENLDSLIKAKRLTEIPGIGPGLASNITELVKTGEMKILSQLREELPVGVIELSEIPGLTVSRIQKLQDELGIESVEQLEKACVEERVRGVTGFGAKTEKKILESLRNYKYSQKKMLLVHALLSAELLVKHLRLSTKASSVEIVGEMRRWHEIVDIIKIHVETKQPEKVWSAIGKYPLTTQIIETTEKFCRVKLVEDIVVEVYWFPNATTSLIEQTGSAAHVEQLKDYAQRKGFKLDALGLSDSDGDIKCKDEADVYKALGLRYIPPELREGDDEIERAENGEFDDLIAIEQIQGMTHCHTTFSDGSYSVLDMARAAEKMGMKYLTITDHSPTAHYAGGLNLDDIKRQWEEIDAAQEKVRIRLLKGTESDILADGKLDYPDNILEQFDIIIASVHNRYKLDHEQMTKRVLNCMRNPHFKIWGHPLGRLVLKRPPIDCNVEKILDAIAESRAAIEVNGDPYRLDMEPGLLKLARERGIKFVISTDAHSIRDFANLRFGVHMARRAGVQTNEVLNTLSFEKFKKFVKPA